MSNWIGFAAVAASLSAVLLSGGCDCQDVIVSDNGQLGFEDPYRYSLGRPFASGDAVVEGSTFCPRVVQWYEGPQGTCTPIAAEPQRWLEPCWSQQIDGAVRVDEGGCLVFEAPGYAQWSIEPRGCEVEVDSPPFGPDQLRFDVRALEGLRGTLVWEFERTAEVLRSPGPSGSFPTDWTNPLGADVRVVEGAAFFAALGLYDPATMESIASSDSVVTGEALAGQPELETLQDVALARLELRAEDRIRLDLQVGQRVVQGPNFVGVAADAVEQLRLFAVYDRPEGSELWGPPTGVRAIVRDPEGRLLRAPGVQWTVEGIDVELGDPVSFDDVLRLPLECTDEEPRPRRARITARLGAVVDTVELEWVERPCVEPPPDPFRPPPELDLGLDCACRSDGSGGRGVALLLPLMLLARRRRR